MRKIDKLNLGCGTVLLDNFINVDHRIGIGDVVDDSFKLESFSNNSISEIFASHIIEHATYDRVIPILKKWNDLLIDNGILWICVPNFQLVIEKHLSDYINGSINWEFFNSRIFGNASVARKMYGTNELKEVPGIYQYELAFHRSVFTPDMLIDCLNQANFKNIKEVIKTPYKEKHPHEICIKAMKGKNEI